MWQVLLGLFYWHFNFGLFFGKPLKRASFSVQTHTLSLSLSLFIVILPLQTFIL